MSIEKRSPTSFNEYDQVRPSHSVHSNQTKHTLCPFDDKRYLMADGVASLAYGHYNICT